MLVSICFLWPIVNLLASDSRFTIIGPVESIIKGHQVDFRKGGLILQTRRYCAVEKEIFVEIPPFIQWEGISPARPLEELKRAGEVNLDIIGEAIPEGVRASRIELIPVAGEYLVDTPEEESRVEHAPDGPYSIYTYTGYASWFNCPTGAGRCGSCNTSRSDQCAWLALDTCGSCSWSCCDCSRGCKNQIYLWCGKDVKVIDLCQSKSRTVYIADCGPNQISYCSRRCNDCKGRTSPVIDLTRPTFAYFYDPATRGCFSCKVEVTVLSPLIKP